ncbi:MAG TPA: cytochrome B [Cyclobacteriaceae bacterium]|nr:cytochrome B [Cyclobacteriaceae bacterium]
MYNIFLHSHSYIRYFILICLIAVIIKSFIGWLNNKPYTAFDNKLGLYLLIFTHLQLVAGIVLYFISPFVQFNSETMKDKVTRFWTVEHVTGMLIVVALITIARSTSKRMSSDQLRHKRLAIVNLIALIVVIAMLALSGRGVL